MKKIMSVLLLLCMLLALLPVAALAEDEEAAAAPAADSIAEMSAEESAEPSEEDATEENVDASDNSADGSAITPMDAEISGEEPTEESVEESTEESVEEPTEESVEEPTEESVEESTEESVEESTEEVVTEPHTVSVSTTNKACASITINGEEVSSLSVVPGETVTIVAKPNEGYENLGCLHWSVEITALEPGVYTFTMPAEDVDLSVDFLSHWVSVGVNCTGYGTATLKVNGEEQSGERSQALPGDTVTIVTNPKSGYGRIAFKADSVTLTEEPKGNYSFTVPENAAGLILTELYFYSDEAVAVTYDWQDGSSTTSYYLAESPVWIDDYRRGVSSETVCTGWAVGSPDSDTILPLGIYQIFTQDTILYAKYEKPVKLTYHWLGRERFSYASPRMGERVLEAESYENGAVVAWSTEPDGGGERYDAGAEYIFDKDTDLYPVYANKTNTLTYHYYFENGQEGTFTELVSEGSYSDVKRVTRETVAYWAVGSPNSDVKYLEGEFVEVNEDLDLYAVMAEETVTLTYCYGVDDYEMFYRTVAKGYDVLLPEVDVFVGMVPLGMAFVGWSLERDGDLIESDRVKVSEDTKLYAIWARELLVTYDANGGVGGEQFVVTAGNLLYADDTHVTREGYEFKGWATDKEGTKLFDFSQPITANTTLYAVWEQPGEDEPNDEPSGEQSGEPVGNPDNVRTDDSTGVTVEVPEEDKAKIEGLVFVASPLPQDKETLVVAVLGTQMSGKVEKSFVLDIYFAKAETGDVATVEGVQRTITVPIPDGWDAKQTHVVYVDPESGRVENMNGIVSADGKTISFTTSHFSYYALVQMEAEPEETPAPTVEPETTPSAAPTATSKPAENAKAPKTGDEAPLALWLALATVSVLAVAIIARKKKVK